MERKNRFMSEDIFMMTAGLRNERLGGEDQKKVPRHYDVPVTSYLDAYNLVTDTSEEAKAEELLSIKDMLPQIALQK